MQIVTANVELLLVLSRGRGLFSRGTMLVLYDANLCIVAWWYKVIHLGGMCEQCRRF